MGNRKTRQFIIELVRELVFQSFPLCYSQLNILNKYSIFKYKFKEMLKTKQLWEQDLTKAHKNSHTFKKYHEKPPK